MDSKSIKLINITQSDRKDKRFAAKFDIDGKTKTVHFGADSLNTYIDHKDKNRRKNYKNRHQHDKIDDPTTAGALSYHVLWGEHTNLKDNLRDYRKRFGV